MRERLGSQGCHGVVSPQREFYLSNQQEYSSILTSAVTSAVPHLPAFNGMTHLNNFFVEIIIITCIIQGITINHLYANGQLSHFLYVETIAFYNEIKCRAFKHASCHTKFEFVTPVITMVHVIVKQQKIYRNNFFTLSLSLCIPAHRNVISCACMCLY